MNPEEMQTMLHQMQQDIEKLSNSTKDIDVAEIVDNRIAQWEKRRITLIVLILAIFGIASYVSLNEKITNYFAKSVTVKIDEEVKKKTALISTQDPQLADLNTRYDDLSNTVIEISKTINKTSEASASAITPPPRPIPAVEKGYAFFGIKTPTGSWSERYFDIQDAYDRIPEQGDMIIATGSVNIRKGYIMYTSDGWVNQPSIGVARPNDKFIIDDVREVTGGFWWVSIVKQ